MQQMKLPGAIRSEYLTDPRLMMAQQLQQAGSSTAPVQSPVEGLARMLQAGLGGYQQRKVRDEYQRRGDEYNRVISEALRGDVPIQLRQDMLMGNPDTAELGQQLAMGRIQQQMRPDPLVAALAKQGKIYDPETGRVAEMPGFSEIDVQRKLREAEALQPLKIQQRMAGKPNISLAVNGQQETEFQKRVGKEYGEQYSNIMNAGRQANTTISNLERLDQLLENVQTGKFKPTTTELKKSAKALGFDLEAMGITDDVAPVEAATALSNQMALEMRNPAGGAGMPGALSDADRAYLQQMTANVSDTPEGRKLKMETRRKLAQRDREVAKLAEDYRRRNGTFDEGFYSELAEWSDQNPLFEGGGMAEMPQAGQVMDGYRFIGGDPSDPNSWEQVQ